MRRWNGALAVRTLLPVLSLPEPVFRDEQVPYEERKIPRDIEGIVLDPEQIARSCRRYIPNFLTQSPLQGIPDYKPSFRERKSIFPSRRGYSTRMPRR